MTDQLVLILIVGAVAVSLMFGCVLFLFFRKPITPSQWLLYYIDMVIARLMWRVTYSRKIAWPREQGVVIIANHRSSIDPCLIQVVAGPRVVHWMVAQLYEPRSLIGWAMRSLEIIPVQRRGKDVSATKEAIRLAAAGEPVGMLPEGTINRSDEFMRPVRPGAILVALKAKAMILPIYIDAAPYHDVTWRPMFMRARVRVEVGELIDLSEYYGREGEEGVVAKLTYDCVREIAKLAGKDDFEPQIAGRDWKTWQ